MKFLFCLAMALYLSLTFLPTAEARSIRHSVHPAYQSKLTFFRYPRFFLMAGVQEGGDVLQSVTDETTNEVVDDVKAGSLINVQGGLNYPIFDGAFSLQAAAGIVYDRVHANVQDADASFTRHYGELLAFMNYKRVRLGVGGSYRFSVTYDVNIPGVLTDSIEFEPVLAQVLQVDFIVDRDFVLGLRATRVEYRVADIPEILQDQRGVGWFAGDSVGAHVIYYF